MTLGPNDALALGFAIRTGDVAKVRALVAAQPELAEAELGGPFQTRTSLSVVTDWPGYFANGPVIVGVLLAAGANPNGVNPNDETPLHWAASSDDVDVAAALIDGGADLEAPNGSIGTPLDNAVGYGCWHVARLLVARGAVVDKLWQASALGLLNRLEELLAVRPAPSPEAVSQAFWHACDGGQRRAAELLLTYGADLNWTPDYAHGSPLDAARNRGTRETNVIEWLESLGASSVESTSP